MGVGVAIAVKVPALVDGDTADGELHVLTLAGVEAAHEHLLGVPLTPLVGQENSGRQLQQLRSVPRGISASAPTRIWKSETPRLTAGRRPSTVTSSAAGPFAGAEFAGSGGAAGTSSGTATGMDAGRALSVAVSGGLRCRGDAVDGAAAVDASAGGAAGGSK